ncbi:MAG: M23 family metallopeptidase [Ferruginibacter sp.]
MKAVITFFLFLSSTCLFAQETYLKIFAAQKTGGGAIIYGKNDAFCPVSVSLELNLKNLGFTNEGKQFIVIPPKTDSFNLGELNVIDPKKGTKYSYHYTFNYGDRNLKSYDNDFVYSLPFQKGKSFILYQGYNGNFSHQDANALDFTMPEGTEVLAARDGIVIKVVQNNTESCPNKDCMKYNNEIFVYHPDGTFATYAHIKYNGARVKPGDQVKAGDLIAYSGNTGWSSGPHLHFACYFNGFERNNTITTKFKVKEGSAPEYLQEKKTYLKEY